MKAVMFDDGLKAFLRGKGVTLDHSGLQYLVEGKPVTFEPPICLGADFFKRSLEIGAFSYAVGGRLWDVEIGRYTSIAEGVRIGLGGHPWDHLTTSPVPWIGMEIFEDFLNQGGGDVRRGLLTNDFQAFKTTRIGNDVWIGAGTYIRDGVTIGDGAIVGAHSVVTKDVPPYAIVAGSPARLVRMRFRDAVIERLLQFQWWRYSLYDLHGVDFTKPEEALARIEVLADGGLAPYAPSWLSLDDLLDAYQAQSAD